MIEVHAKPLKWTVGRPHPDGWQVWRSLTNVCILFDPEQDVQTRYVAEWNEHDTESFATLEAAKQWCQRKFNAWIREVAYVDVAEGWTHHPRRARLTLCR